MAWYDFFYNAATGNLTQDQVNAIVSQNNQDIANAGKGQPAVIKAQQEAGTKDIMNVLSTLSLPGESKSDAGALPSQATLRLPLIGQTTIQNVEKFRQQVTWAVIAIGLIAGAVIVAPYVAPSIGRAVRSVKRA